ncbi:substrate-binding periplasmic protein [Desulfuromonas thiophila]|uniref:substrate-binding periplasmic protein n=1 Tax=Desulfuromonas thiophila TaxID=57664 RepID=UPI0024A83F57|nr:transporter substrate-binding domain-containing protein [Desulfuromonas thiophila]
MLINAARLSAISVIVSLISLVVLVLSGCSDSSSHHKTTLTVAIVDQNPYSFVESGTIVGTDVDIAKAMAENAGVALSLEVLDSAAQALEQTEAGPNRALLGVVYSAERKDRYQWVGPINRGSYWIYAKKDQGVGTSVSLDEVKGISKIGVVEDWLEATILEGLGFENLRYYPSYAEAYDAFIHDEVDAFASDSAQLGEWLRDNDELDFFTDIDFCYRYNSSYYYMAFSKDVDPEVIQSLQQSLDALKDSGTTLDIFKNYIPEAEYVIGKQQLFTENAPPFTYYEGTLQKYTVAGSSAEIVNEIQTRINQQESMTITSWRDGFDTVKYLPNSALFTTARTAEREPLFQWVGPIAAMHAGFYTLAEKEFEFVTLDQAKNLTGISTPNGWYTHDYLVAQGFGNIVATASNPLEAFNQLLTGEVDALFIYHEGIDWLCNAAGIERTEIVRQFEDTAAYQEGWIAFSLDTPQETVSQWQSALDAMYADGTFASLWEKWFGAAPLPTGDLDH